MPARQSSAPRALSILSYAILLAGIITIGLSIYMAVVSYSSLPYWDGWIQINFAADGGNPFTLGWLWSQYNEHRMPIPKLFLLADLGWFHAWQVSLLLSIFLIQLLHVVVLIWSLRVFGGWRGAIWRTGAGLVAFCLFCPSQWENLTWGMQVCFVLPGLLASLSVIGLLLYWTHSSEPQGRPSSNWKYLLLSLAAALGATWSYVNGNLLWPLLLAAALLLGVRRAALIYAIAGTLSTAAYLQDYLRPSYAMNSTKDPVNMVKYLAAYFGSSWVGSGGFGLAEDIGVAGLAVCFLLLLRLRSYVQSRSPLEVQLVLTSLFCAGTGLTTTVGRSGLGVSQAFSSRYQTVSLVFWCCLGLLLLGAASSLRRRREVAVLLSQVLFLAIMLVGARFANTPLIRARVRGFKLNTAAMSLVTDVPDSDQLRWAFWRPDYLPSIVPYMRRERLSVFAEPDSWLLGKPLISAFQIAAPIECAGEVESNVPMGGTATPASPSPLRITGWAWDHKYNRPPSRIVVAGNGVIVGLGAVGDWRPMDKTAHPWMTTHYIGYTGYVQADRAAGPLEVYAIQRSSPATACMIATVK